MTEQVPSNAVSRQVPCAECGMLVVPGEYHPFAACLMFKACHNSETVEENLAAVKHAGWQEACSAHEPCPGCAEFVRMQHDIASLLGVDADTDSIDLHGRIYGALSTRAAQPPAVGSIHGLKLDRPGWVCSVCHGWNEPQDDFCTHTHPGSHPTKPGEQA